VITAVHTIVYTSDPDATRAFFRDVLEFPSVDTGRRLVDLPHRTQ
jgi:catechol 2,3-dioxygenase-like lactoylglutathione lyase family enzyme